MNRLEKKTTATLLIAIFMISAFAVAIPVNAATITVGPGKDYATISEALLVAVDLDVIEVYADTYVENLQISKDITLTSVDGPTTTIILGVVDALEKEVIELVSGSTGTTIGGSAGHGFTIKYPEVTATGGWPIEVTNGDANIEISHNIIDSTGVASMGISVGAAGATGLTISNNEFIEPDEGHGSIWGVDLVDVTVSDNTFTGPGPGTTSGYAVQFAGITGTSVISGNTISGYGTGIFPQTAEGLTPISGLTISGNVITGCAKGIRLGHSTNKYAMNTMTITQNILSENTIGLYVADHTGIDLSTLTIKDNDFLMTNTLCLDNDNAETVDATSNWWETTDPLVIAGMVQGFVDYIPCLSQSAVDLTATVIGWILDVQIFGLGTVTKNPLMDPILGYSTDVVVTLTAVPAAGYEFSAWAGVDSSVGDTATVTMSADKEVTATFTEIPVVSISVLPTTVALSGKIGAVVLNQEIVTVTNDGNVAVDVTATLTGTGAEFFMSCLTIGDTTVSWPYLVSALEMIAPGAFIDLALGLNLSGETIAATYSATLVFEATPEPPP